MPWDLILRQEVPRPLNLQEHEYNFTTINTALNVTEARVSSLTSIVSSKMADLADDKTPELGGPLDGLNFAVKRVVDQVGVKTLPFSYAPNDGRVITFKGVSDVTVTLPTNLGTCPLGTGFELYVVNNVVVTLQTDQTTPTVQRPGNFDGHYKVVGPNGAAFLRVMDAVSSKAVWALAGNTIP